MINKGKELLVAAIENGTVIDHLPVGSGMRIIHLLNLSTHHEVVSLALNLRSKTLGLKDLIKLEGREISDEEASQIAIFAPKATLNIIRQFECVRKFKVHMPEIVEHVFNCVNERCITRHENMGSKFKVYVFGKQVDLICFYCEKRLSHESI